MLSFAVHCIFLRTLKSKNLRQELESYAHFFEGSGHISGIFLVCFWSRSKLKDFQHVFVPSFYADETLLLVLFCFVLFYNIVLCSSWKLSSSLKSPWKLSRSLKLVKTVFADPWKVISEKADFADPLKVLEKFLDFWKVLGFSAIYLFCWEALNSWYYRGNRNQHQQWS